MKEPITTYLLNNGLPADILGQFFPEIERKILKKYEHEKDLRNIDSLISEVRFGQLFLKTALNPTYELKINKKTPDWSIEISDQKFICEVYRVNKSQKDFLIAKDLKLMQINILNPNISKVYQGRTYKNEITKKLKAYQEICQVNRLYLILALDFELLSGLDIEDVKSRFIDYQDFTSSVNNNSQKPVL